jgi:hypothetical protein
MAFDYPLAAASKSVLKNGLEPSKLCRRHNAIRDNAEAEILSEMVLPLSEMYTCLSGLIPSTIGQEDGNVDTLSSARPSTITTEAITSLDSLHLPSVIAAMGLE